MIDCRLQTWPYLLEMDVLNGHRREKKTHVTTEEMGDRRGKSSVGGIWTRKDKELLQKNVVDYQAYDLASFMGEYARELRAHA